MPTAKVACITSVTQVFELPVSPGVHPVQQITQFELAALFSLRNLERELGEGYARRELLATHPDTFTTLVVEA